MFIVFGTTRTFRKTLYKKLVPQRFQKHPVEEEPIATADPEENTRDEEYARNLHDAANREPVDTRLNNLRETPLPSANASEPHKILRSTSGNLCDAVGDSSRK